MHQNILRIKINALIASIVENIITTLIIAVLRIAVVSGLNRG
jgi:hypothetical protein